jgi:hypothetical protein
VALVIGYFFITRASQTLTHHRVGVKAFCGQKLGIISLPKIANLARPYFNQKLEFIPVIDVRVDGCRSNNSKVFLWFFCGLEMLKMKMYVISA